MATPTQVSATLKLLAAAGYPIDVLGEAHRALGVGITPGESVERWLGGLSRRSLAAVVEGLEKP